MSTRPDQSWRSIPFDRRNRLAGGGNIRLTPTTLLLIILTNALISLFISVVVVLVLGGRGSPTPTPIVASQEAIATPVDVFNTSAPQAPAVNPAEPAATERADLYVVKSGDSLSAIAARFGLTMNELMAANGLQNPDWIGVGQKLTIPRPGAPSPTSTVPPVPTLTETPLPFEPPTAAPTLTPAVSAMAAAGAAAATLPAEATAVSGPPVVIERVTGAGNIAAEEIVIASRGKQVNLEKWTLSDSLGNAFVFPNVILWSAQAPLRIHTGAGADTPTDLYWNRAEPVWRGRGELATLKDAQGNVIDTFKP